MRATRHKTNPGEKLPKIFILSHRGWIRTIFEKGRRWNHRLVTLLTHPRPGEEKALVGFLSPKKIGGAVERNRVRRRMREIYRRRLLRPDSPDFHLWLPRPGSVTASLDELAGAMTELIQKSQRNA